MDLTDVRDLIVPEIYERGLLLTAGYPVTETGKALEEMSELFQALGICQFLLTMDVMGFRINLTRSGQARRYFLRKSAELRNIHDHRLALSRSEGFLDSVVAGDWSLARDIVRLSNWDWNGNWEYEDDYCYFMILHNLVTQPGDSLSANIISLAERFERVLEGAPSPRLDVCRALMLRNEDGFAEGLIGLLDEEKLRNDQKRPAVTESQFLFWPRSFISIEGLALLKIAGAAEMTVPSDFFLCPEEARLPDMDGSPSDIFAELDTAIAADGGNPRG